MWGVPVPCTLAVPCVCATLRPFVQQSFAAPRVVADWEQERKQLDEQQLEPKMERKLRE